MLVSQSKWIRVEPKCSVNKRQVSKVLHDLNLADSATAAAAFPTREENLVFGPQLPQAGLGRATGGLGRAAGGLGQRQGRVQQVLNRGQGVQGRRQGGRRQDG